jgi:hypothetical protein
MGKQFDRGGRQYPGPAQEFDRSGPFVAAEFPPRIMHGRCREVLALLDPNGRRENYFEVRSMLLLLLLLSVDLAPSGTRLNTGDSFKSKTDVDNKRHTNAHRPLTSPSPIGISILPSPPDSPNSVQRRDLLTSRKTNFYMIRVLPSLSGCTVVAHIVSRDFIAFAASTLTVFT